jgi:predicted metal-dependent hydrolase
MPFDYTIKKSKRARNISIRITTQNEVILTYPHWGSETQAIKFLQQNQENILSRISKNKVNTKKFDFTNLEKIHYLGEELTLYVVEKSRSTFKATVSGSELVVLVPDGEKNNKALIRKAIHSEFKKQFRQIVEEGVEEYNKFYNFEYNRIAIKDNRTNWGSCSTKGNLNFNWKLIFAPLEVIDYVIVHELCHLKEHNHSKHFWDLVAEQIPNHKLYRKWLKENGNGLIL